jgi:hypothetical protein
MKLKAAAPLWLSQAVGRCVPREICIHNLGCSCSSPLRVCMTDSCVFERGQKCPSKADPCYATVAWLTTVLAVAAAATAAPVVAGSSLGGWVREREGGGEGVREGGGGWGGGE